MATGLKGRSQRGLLACIHIYNIYAYIYIFIYIYIYMHIYIYMMRSVMTFLTC